MGARRAIGIVSLAIAATACSKTNSGAAGTAGAPGTGGASSPAGSGGSVGSGGSSTSSGGTSAGSGGVPSAVGGAGGSGGAMGSGGALGGSASGGTAGAGAGGMGGQGQGIGGDGMGGQGVAPGTCGISRWIPLPDFTSVEGPGPVRREANGFVVGPWFSTRAADGAQLVNWLRVDASGQSVMYGPATPPSTGGLDFLNVGAPNQLTGFITDGFASGPANYYSVVATVQDGMASAGAAQRLLYVSAFSNLLDSLFAAPALDGQHELLVVSGDMKRQANMAVVAADGSLLGDVTTWSTPQSWTCGALQPTAQAGLLSVVDGNAGSEAFHALELTATGDVAWEVSAPLQRDRPPGWNASALPCPQVALSQSGLAFLSYESGGSGSAWHLHQLARDGSATDEAWATLSSGSPRGLAIRDQVAMAMVRHADSTVSVVKRTNGQDQEWALPLDVGITVLGTDGPIASEAGALFLDVSSPHDASAPSRRWIVEVSCP